MNKDIINTSFFIHQLKQGQNSAFETDFNPNKKDLRIIQAEKSILISYPNDKFILPIPLKEINSNPTIKPQNTGY